MTQDKRDMGDNGRRKEPSQVTAEVGRVSEALRDKKAHDGSTTIAATAMSLS